MVQLDNWSIVSIAWDGCQRNPYQDEFREVDYRLTCLHGRSFGHPMVESGHRIRTNVIIEIDGNKVITASGTVYELLDMNQEYKEFLKLNGLTFPALWS